MGQSRVARGRGTKLFHTCPDWVASPIRRAVSIVKGIFITQEGAGNQPNAEVQLRQDRHELRTFCQVSASGQNDSEEVARSVSMSVACGDQHETQ